MNEHLTGEDTPWKVHRNKSNWTSHNHVQCTALLLHQLPECILWKLLGTVTCYWLLARVHFHNVADTSVPVFLSKQSSDSQAGEEIVKENQHYCFLGASWLDFCHFILIRKLLGPGYVVGRAVVCLFLLFLFCYCLFVVIVCCFIMVRNHQVLKEAARHVTRFIGLASVGNPHKKKVLHPCVFTTFLNITTSN